ncbi:MAG TPA: DAK2 domain-containing protein [Gaiellaceae bacterium]|nr:DAK2 domain-containing protein [Gaiellaceae bacterium]
MPEVGPGREGRLEICRAALAALEASRRRIDDLNVYPVPDGDTGTNMALTVRAVVEALERDPGADLTRAILMGARGNSGVILSQLVRGAAEELPDGATVDPTALAGALRAASDAGYAAVRNAQEGTILTLARELAERAEALTESPPSLPETLRELVAHGEGALARTQDQLDVLREAGVVDAGAAGLLEIVRGIAAHVTGEPLPESEDVAGTLPLEAVHQELSRFRYCTSFYVEGDDVDPETLEAELGKIGDSLLVVGAPGAVKAHVHTDEPGRALSLATALGVLAEVEINNMHAQTLDREERLTRVETRTGVVAVCAGAGTKRLFESLGAHCVEGGQSMNPSTSEIVAAVEAVPAEEVVVLPNNKNVILAAEQAAAASEKAVHVVPTRSLQAGLGAMVSFEGSRSAEENVAEMTEAAAGVRAGAVTRASRTTSLGALEIEQGQFLGLVDEEPVTSGPALEPVAREVAERLLGEATDVLTILAGEEAEGVEDLAGALRDAHPELEIEVHEGGQPQYPLLFSAE